ncbi:MAG: SLBB domain-containing protein [Alphaproteobacteria bacterium]|nr:SLBB domain-containing protein [Alphaproteobacteria bacterium]
MSAWTKHAAPFSVFCFLLLLTAFTTRGFSETRFPVVPPWLDNERDQAAEIARDLQTHPFSRTVEQAENRGAIPDGPVLTPRDTRALLEQMDKAHAARRSRLEAYYSGRIVDELDQFGYDMFGTATAGTDSSPTAVNIPIPSGAVQDDFILGTGDSLTVTFRGERTDSRTYPINSQGFLVVDELPPIAAAGRPIGQLRQMLEAEAAKRHDTQVYVSLDSVRQIGVLVVGHVKKPGRQTLTVFHTVLDALSAAGGVEKTGSLRQIKLIRSGRSTWIDLYGLLIHGDAGMDLGLRDGDRIIVPPIGPTVAIAGSVKRPGIYEIPRALRGMWHTPDEASEKRSLEEILAMAGGVLAPGENRFVKLGLTTDGRETVDEITAPYAPLFGDGTILMVAASTERRAGTVELTGHTRRPGLHALAQNKTLAALLSDETAFGPDIYPLIGVVERWDKNQLSRTLTAFSPLLVLKGGYDRKLQDGDVVHLFSRTQIVKLGDSEKAPGTTEEGSNEDATADIVPDKALRSFLRERAAFVRGAVRDPGPWPVAEGVSLENLLAAAGGATLEADTSRVELTSALSGEGHQSHGKSGTRRTLVNFREQNPANILIAAGDAVRFNQTFGKPENTSVLITGEVKHPGRYDLLPGDKLSDLLERAGSLTTEAYPDGAIFSRESERRAEESRFHMQAQDLEIKLAAALEQKDAPDATQIAAVQQLVDQLKQAQAVGRITVEADPGALATEPALDMLLESGDRVYIPRRPLMVRVAGEVLSPAALQFRKDKDPRDYIMEAGGFTFHADKSRVFVLYPDGSAQPLLVDVWNHKAAFIPPGSTIVVPRDPKPFDFLETARDLSQIIANLAITGIWIDDLSH